MCMGMGMECVTVKLNFENRIAYHGESESVCVSVSVGGDDQTAICATVTWPHLSNKQAYANIS